jgi:flagellar hook-associated protein 1
MSLFGSIQMAGNTLQAMQIGLHVVGNNIANANTPGFIRERVVYTPAPVQKLGELTLG